MSNSKRSELAGTGRGAVGKEAVVGVKDRESNQVAVRHVQHTDGPHVAGFVAENVKLGATVYTDESTAYNSLAAWYDHESGESLHQGVREGHGAHEWCRELLEHDEARDRRHLSQTVAEAPASVRF